MSYYTNYSIEMIRGKGEVTYEDLIRYFRKHEDLNFEGQNGLEAAIDYYGTWYDHDVDMTLLSIVYPNVLFCLHGSGENAPDFWRKYYQNGKMQECVGEVVYPDYDPSKMKEDEDILADIRELDIVKEAWHNHG